MSTRLHEIAKRFADYHNARPPRDDEPKGQQDEPAHECEQHTIIVTAKPRFVRRSKYYGRW